MIHFRSSYKGEWAFGVSVYRIFGHDDFFKQATIEFWRWRVTIIF